MKKLVFGILAATAVLSLAACGNADTGEQLEAVAEPDALEEPVNEQPATLPENQDGTSVSLTTSDAADAAEEDVVVADGAVGDAVEVQ